MAVSYTHLQVQVSLNPRYSGSVPLCFISSHSVVNSCQVVGTFQPFSSNRSLLYKIPAAFATYGSCLLYTSPAHESSVKVPMSPDHWGSFSFPVSSAHRQRHPAAQSLRRKRLFFPVFHDKTPTLLVTGCLHPVSYTHLKIFCHLWCPPLLFL